MATSTDIEGDSIELGSGENFTIEQTVNLILNNIDEDINPEFKTIKKRMIEIERLTDMEKTFNKMGRKTMFTLEKGLKKTIDYYSKLNKN